MSDDQELGWIIDVYDEPLGSALAANGWVGDPEIAVVDAVSFDGDGGWLQIEDVLYEYVAVDLDDDTITLAGAGLMGDIDADTEVAVWDLEAGSPAVEGRALVEWLTDVADDDPISCLVAQGLRDRLPLGSRDGRGETVTVERFGSMWRVVDIHGTTLKTDLTHADPGTYPPILGPPTSPPGASPEITVYSLPTSLMVKADEIVQSTLIEYHIAVASFTPIAGDPATLAVPATRATVVSISELPDGSPLQPETLYHLRALGVNDLGSAPVASLERTAMLNLEAVAELVTSTLIAERVIAAALEAGSVAVGNITIDPTTGITIPQPNGGVIHFPADGTAAMIQAYAVLYGATVQDNLGINGLAQLFGIMRMNAGVSKPTTPPGVTHTWPHVVTGLADTPEFTPYHYGLVEFDATQFATTIAILGVGRVVTFDKVTGATTFVYPDFGLQSNGGIAKTESGRYFVLGQDQARGWDWYVYELDPVTFLKIGEHLLAVASTIQVRPTIGAGEYGWFGNTLYVAFRLGTSLRVRAYSPTTWTYSEWTLPHGQTPLGHLASVDVGTFDLLTPGSPPRILVSLANRAVLAFDSFGSTRVGGNEFPTASNQIVNGMHWDGTRFLQLDVNGRVWSYADGHPTQSSPDLAYTNYDGDVTGGVHETTEGPRRNYTWPARSWLAVTTPPPPDDGNTDPGATDKANRCGVYASSSPGGVLNLQGYLPAGDRTAVLEELISGPAPGVNPTFAGLPSGIGKFESSAGDGVGPYTSLDGAGKVRMAKFQQRGTAASGTLVAGVVTTVTVTFPVPFDVVPVVVCSAMVIDGTVFKVTPSAATTTGFDMNFIRSSGTSGFSGAWIASTA